MEELTDGEKGEEVGENCREVLSSERPNRQVSETRSAVSVC